MTGSSVLQALDEADTILSAGEGGETIACMTPAVIVAPEQADMFSTYLVTPTYYANIGEKMLTIKLASSKGEPFFLMDKSRKSQPLVCSMTQVHLTPYDAESACSDVCDGMPEVHVIPDQVAEALYCKALQGISTAAHFSGIVFISNVSMQFYHSRRRTSRSDGAVTCATSSTVYRVASDDAGHVDVRDKPGAEICDYPVPYFLVDYSEFAGGQNTCAIIESLVKANVALIDTLCRIEYTTLHQAEKFPEILDNSLAQFMSRHSNTVRSMLNDQESGEACDSAIVRRQRKAQIDTFVRLMMREVELITSIEKSLRELCEIQSIVERESPAEIAAEEEENDTLPNPLSKCGEAKFEAGMKAPLVGCDPDIANAEMLRSPSDSSVDSAR